MNYPEFKNEYINVFNLMMSYSPSEVGSGYYAEKMAKLNDEYPEFAIMVEGEIA